MKDEHTTVVSRDKFTRELTGKSMTTTYRTMLLGRRGEKWFVNCPYCKREILTTLPINQATIRCTAGSHSVNFILESVV